MGDWIVKTDAFKRNRFSGDYYNYVTENVGDEQVSVHTFTKNIKFTMGANSGERVKFYSIFPLRVGARILNIRDNRNMLILPNQYFQITSITPIFDIFGKTISYECISSLSPYVDLGNE